MSLPLLPAFYFGSVEHYRLLAKHPRVLIDIGEHYERQSYRTRTGIVGPNGPQGLSVHIVHDHGSKTPMRNMRLSYAETWPQQHLHAIRSAYGQAPWFIHYIDDVEQVLLARHERLIDLLLATVQLGMHWLKLPTAIDVSDRYIEGAEYRFDGAGSGPVAPATPPAQRQPILDLRMSLHPKRPLPLEVTAVPPYPQVFADRHGFVPRMSILDLVCNCGPGAVARVLA